MPAQQSLRTHRFAAVLPITAITVGLAPGRAMAELRVLLVPVTATDTTVLTPPQERFSYCPGSYGGPPPVPVPMEWEVTFENPGMTAASGVLFDDDLGSGMNGSFLRLICPPTLLPPGVTPADVSCDAAANTLSVRNISVAPCEPAHMRFAVVVDAVSSVLQDTCNGATITNGAATLRSQSPLGTDQVPQSGGDTCFYTSSSCAPRFALNLRLFVGAEDQNGAPLLPGDSLLYTAAFDLTYFRLAPSLPLDHYDGNSDAGAALIALPPYLDFVAFVDKPLEAAGAIYEFLPGPRTLRVYDPDPTDANPVNLPTGQVVKIVSFVATLNAAIPMDATQCLQSNLVLSTVGGVRSEEPHGFQPGPDPTCVGPVGPPANVGNRLRLTHPSPPLPLLDWTSYPDPVQPHLFHVYRTSTKQTLPGTRVDEPGVKTWTDATPAGALEYYQVHSACGSLESSN